MFTRPSTVLPPGDHLRKENANYSNRVLNRGVFFELAGFCRHLQRVCEHTPGCFIPIRPRFFFFGSQLLQNVLIKVLQMRFMRC